MDYNTYKILEADAFNALIAHRLGGALNSMTGMVTCAGVGAVADDVSRLQADYDLMLNYMSQGYPDEGRIALHKKFQRQAIDLWFQASRLADIGRNDHRTTYASTFKTLQSMNAPHSPVQLAANSESVSPRVLFESLWTSAMWSKEDNVAVQLLYKKSDGISRALLLSATMLGALHYFDIRKLALLIEAIRFVDETAPRQSEQTGLPTKHDGGVNISDVICRVRALVGAVLVTLRWSAVLPFYPEVTELWEKALADQQLTEQFSALQTLLLMTLEVKRIEKKMQKEIIPGVMNKVHILEKIQGKIKGLTSVDDFSMLTTNPEWDKDISKLSDEMQKMHEMQQKGADVFISSFSTLKSRFPFFSAVPNWFYPFTTKNTDLPEAARNSTVAKVMENNVALRQQLCDSDCYSISLVLAGTGNSPFSNAVANMQESLGLNLNEQLNNLSDTDNGSLEYIDTEKAMHRVQRSYIQDLYRYFKLFTGREERVDPFKCDLFLPNYAPFAKALNSSNTLKDLGDFSFSISSYTYALAFYQKVEDPTMDFVEISQKMGYCYQIDGDYDNAVRNYEYADVLKGNSVWTLRQLAMCYRRLGKIDDALRVYKELCELSPDDVSIALRTALCYIEKQNFDKAMRLLYKAYYLSPENTDVLRALAWCCFSLRLNNKADKYYAKILEAEPKPDDYLNAGHVAWVSGNVAKAVERYKSFVRLQGDDYTAGELFKDDAALLCEQGISEEELQIMCDAVEKQ